MSTDTLHILLAVVALVAVVAVPIGALMVYEKKTRKKRRRGGSVSSSDSFNDILNSMD